MIKRLLIANRGEIAVRVIDTCKKMGITSLAIYSEADRHSKHVELSDEAYYIGDSEASASYLNEEKILQLAKKVNADGIHPGYGFLSENPGFVHRCESEDIIFVGPRHDVVARMGSKIESKHIALACDVPTVPGYFGEDQSKETLALEAAKIGTPLMIKASAGGGGRGIRIVDDLARFPEALALATKEAMSAFGDASVLLERYIKEPRHLEVQILGDQHGNIVHLFERECSIQRNHQKLVEEAPAGFLTNDLRELLFEYALRLANEIQYSSTGTVEFILDNQSNELFFLEMNTRLQVEHPVTECITGLDLVECQINIASNLPLPFDQTSITQSGWAIEGRITAENPAHNYRPETGHISFYKEPTGVGIRIDSGVQQGSEITPFYDSMISKVIAHGQNREQARRRILTALGDFTLAGVSNNILFLKDTIGHPNFLQAALTTHFLERCFIHGWQPPSISTDNLLALVVVTYLQDTQLNLPQNASPWHSLETWRITDICGLKPQTTLTLSDDQGKKHTVGYQKHNNGYAITANDAIIKVQNIRYQSGSIIAEVDGALLCYQTNISGSRIIIASHTHAHEYFKISQRDALSSNSATELSGEGIIKAPMPGSIEAVKVSQGDIVKKGEVLVVMEAMKMVQNLESSIDGTISQIHYVAGDTVKANAVLIEIEETA